MTDRISKEHRSWNMSRIRGKDTKPELAVRSMLHRMGYRFRLHVKDLPGKPDIVLPKYRTVIFVHGCFWHRHPRCKYAYAPKSRARFWRWKLDENVNRDRKARRALRVLGWRVLTVWECEAYCTERLVKGFFRDLTGNREKESPR
jgi:DNA mismatch endonuclease (patch repair protein)